MGVWVCGCVGVCVCVCVFRLECVLEWHGLSSYAELGLGIQYGLGLFRIAGCSGVQGMGESCHDRARKFVEGLCDVRPPALPPPPPPPKKKKKNLMPVIAKASLGPQLELQSTGFNQANSTVLQAMT